MLINRHSFVRCSFVFLGAVMLLGVGRAVAEHAGPRIVAIGDVHGAYNELVLLLQRVNLIDDELRWSGGDSVFVQTGDLVDRGRDVKKVLDLMMRLEQEAATAGGRVEVLLGNHEALHLVGVLRDVHPDAFETFVEEDSEDRRKDEWKSLKRFVVLRSRELNQRPPDLGSLVRDQWVQEHPPGWFEYRDAFSADGVYGRWIRSRPTALRLGDIFFVHGGLNLEINERSPEAINARVWDEIRRFEAARQWMVEEDLAPPESTLHDVTSVVRTVMDAGPKAGVERFEMAEGLSDISDWYLISPTGPMWYRGMVRGEEEDIRGEVMSLFDADGIAYMVIAHTPQVEGLIQTRFDDRLFLIDTGLNPYHFKAGQPSALEINGNVIRSVYLDDERELVRAAAPIWQVEDAVGAVATDRRETPVYTWLDVDDKPAPYQSTETLEWFLSRADVVDSQTITTGTTRPFKLVLADEKVRMHGIFRYIDTRVRRARGTNLGVAETRLRDRAVHEAAAFRIDRLLRLGRVPAAVIREIDGRTGSVQIWLEGCFREVDRRDQGLAPPDRVYWARQLEVMKVFDALVGNFDRNQGNMLIDENWHLWLIDHTRAFHILPDVVELEELMRCDRRLYQSLAALDDADVRVVLEDVLGSEVIDALISRKNQLVEHFGALIEQRGEVRVLFDLEANEGASPVEDLPELLDIPRTTPFKGFLSEAGG